jgi:hypothetical protein
VKSAPSGRVRRAPQSAAGWGEPGTNLGHEILGDEVASGQHGDLRQFIGGIARGYRRREEPSFPTASRIGRRNPLLSEKSRAGFRPMWR